MNLGKVSSIFIAVAVALILIANAPAILVDPLFTAVAQIRANAATSQAATVTTPLSETTQEVTVAPKVKR